MIKDKVTLDACLAVTSGQVAAAKLLHALVDEEWPIDRVGIRHGHVWLALGDREWADKAGVDGWDWPAGIVHLQANKIVQRSQYSKSGTQSLWVRVREEILAALGTAVNTQVCLHK